MEIPDEATAVFTFHISKGCVENRGVVPIGLGSLCVIDPGEAFGVEFRGRIGGVSCGFCFVAHGF